jgi:hypothetical protein
MSTTIYLAPFHSSFEGYESGECRSTYKPLSDALDRNEWPYDTGDDPSFFSAKRLHGKLTWGICRQQVRNALNLGDIVVFFSFRKRSSNSVIEYSMCAVATVARKVRQTEIWTDRTLDVYRHYLNLLIRPVGDGRWEHFEPGLPRAHWHSDWVWRITNHTGFRKPAFGSLDNSTTISGTPKIEGHVIEITPNYVIFSGKQYETYIVDSPPVVATCEKPGTVEEWNLRSPSPAIKRLTADFSAKNGGRGTLRTKNLQRAHPCDSWVMTPHDAAKWRKELIEICAGIG